MSSDTPPLPSPRSRDRSSLVLTAGGLALALALLALVQGLVLGPDRPTKFLAPVPAILVGPIAILTWLTSAGYLRELRAAPDRSHEEQRTRLGVRLALLALPLGAFGGFALLRGLYASGPLAG